LINRPGEKTVSLSSLSLISRVSDRCSIDSPPSVGCHGDARARDRSGAARRHHRQAARGPIGEAWEAGPAVGGGDLPALRRVEGDLSSAAQPTRTRSADQNLRLDSLSLSLSVFVFGIIFDT